MIGGSRGIFPNFEMLKTVEVKKGKLSRPLARNQSLDLILSLLN
jgi:hypothetical protein